LARNTVYQNTLLLVGLFHIRSEVNLLATILRITEHARTNLLDAYCVEVLQNKATLKLNSYLSTLLKLFLSRVKLALWEDKNVTVTQFLRLSSHMSEKYLNLCRPSI